MLFNIFWIRNTLVYLSCVFSVVINRFKSTNSVENDDIWDIYGCDTDYISDILTYMIVSVIEKFNVKWSENQSYDLKIFAMFSSLYNILNNNSNYNASSSKIKEYVVYWNSVI